MKRIILIVAIAVFGGQTANATIVLSSSDSPLEMLAGTISTETLFVSIASDNADTLFGWQIPLLLLPDPGATGSVGFHSATAPASGYVFDAASNFFNINITTVTSPNDKLEATDLDFQGGMLGSGTVIPELTIRSLLQISFSSTADAKGTFGLYAIDESTSVAEWTDVNQMPQSFANIAVGSMTRIGEVQVSVPEPSAFLMLAGVFAMQITASLRLRLRSK